MEPGAGAARLVEATRWARENHHRLILGEFGFASDEASLNEGAALLSFMRANSDVWEGSAFWAAGPGWGDYFFSVEPDGPKPKPQMALLTKPFACDP